MSAKGGTSSREDFSGAWGWRRDYPRRPPATGVADSCRTSVPSETPDVSGHGLCP